MQDGIKNDPKDHVVVSFHNTEDFGFTPDMGCMFDGHAINGKNGLPGINAGEEITLPYHIGHRLATNLAKITKLRRAPITDELNNPVGKPLWNDVDLENLENSYLKELYSEVRATPMSETDRLMAKVEEYKKMVEQLIPLKTKEAPAVVVEASVVPEAAKALQVFADKIDVIAELEKRGIKFDRRQSKANLEKLIV